MAGHQGQVGGGSIPACAGEPARNWCERWQEEVYPRVCGGTGRSVRPTCACRGLSPRVRGNRQAGTVDMNELGSIPACAGEPGSSSLPFQSLRVYPRVCGGTREVVNLRFRENGLSPRVRGNRQRPEPPHPQLGSIPACAGEPPPLGLRRRTSSVYPRVCGGTSRASPKPTSCSGLSPRVRGNQEDADGRIWVTRSIPACAGEPE